MKGSRILFIPFSQPIISHQITRECWSILTLDIRFSPQQPKIQNIKKWRREIPLVFTSNSNSLAQNGKGHQKLWKDLAYNAYSSTQWMPCLYYPHNPFSFPRSRSKYVLKKVCFHQYSILNKFNYTKLEYRIVCNEWAQRNEKQRLPSTHLNALSTSFVHPHFTSCHNLFTVARTSCIELRTCIGASCWPFAARSTSGRVLISDCTLKWLSPFWHRKIYIHKKQSFMIYSKS